VIVSLRPVRKIGDPVLRRPAATYAAESLASADFVRLIDDLVETMHVEGGIGIAAPQIGEPVRVAVIAIDRASARYPNMADFPLTVFVNPRITVLDPTEQGFWEGCLSVPNLRGYVLRPRGVRVDFLDGRGCAQSLEADGFLATVLQHELDHLDGVLFVDRIRDTTKLATVENYVRYWASTSTEPTEI
jgi:peptide deformylase